MQSVSTFKHGAARAAHEFMKMIESSGLPSVEESSSLTETVELHLCKGNIFVWSANDVKTLREKHHIIGSLTGSLPRSPRQNAQLGLPLQLLPEEAAVLIEYDAARLVNVSIPKPSCHEVSKFKEARKRSFQEQQALWESQNLQKKQQFAATISSGRTTKKHRRAERAKKQKRENANSVPSVNPKDAGDEKNLLKNNMASSETDSEVRKIYHTESILNSNSEPLSQAGRYSSYHVEKSSSSLEQESESVKCSVESDDKEQTVLSLQNGNTVTNTHRADPGITGDSYLHTNCMGERTCTKSGSKQDDKPVNFSPRETEPNLGHRTSKKFINPGGESSYETNLKLQVSKSNTSVTSQDLSTDSNGGKMNSITEIIPDAANCNQQDISQDNSASLISFKESQINCAGCSKQEMLPTTEDSMESQQKEHSVIHSVKHSVTHSVPLCTQDVTSCQPDGLMSSESTINQEILLSEDKEDHIVSTVPDDTKVHVDIFKKPSDPEPSSGYLVHLVTASPTTPREDVTDLTFLINTPQEMLRYKIFKDLWETGYYLTSGCKFGGDFLVYPGDPFLYHSYYIAICIPYQEFLSPLDLITYGRLATNVKKTVIICSVNGNDEVVYTSLQWTGLS